MRVKLEDVIRQLEPGALYYIRTLAPPQRLQREHVLTYLGKGTQPGCLSFNARPFAGTQEIPMHQITFVRKLIRNHQYDHDYGRGSTQHYMNRIYRG